MITLIVNHQKGNDIDGNKTSINKIINLRENKILQKVEGIYKIVIKLKISRDVQIEYMNLKLFNLIILHYLFKLHGPV